MHSMPHASQLDAGTIILCACVRGGRSCAVLPNTRPHGWKSRAVLSRPRNWESCVRHPPQNPHIIESPRTTSTVPRCLRNVQHSKCDTFTFLSVMDTFHSTAASLCRNIPKRDIPNTYVCTYIHHIVIIIILIIIIIIIAVYTAIV